MTIRRLDKLPKRKVTIKELIGPDELTSTINAILRNKNKIQKALFITVESSGESTVYDFVPVNMTCAEMVYYLEASKLCILEDD